jgi:hypothetical protein
MLVKIGFEKVDEGKVGNSGPCTFGRCMKGTVLCFETSSVVLSLLKFDPTSRKTNILKVVPGAYEVHGSILSLNYVVEIKD